MHSAFGFLILFMDFSIDNRARTSDVTPGLSGET